MSPKQPPAKQVKRVKHRILTEPQFALTVFKTIWEAQKPEERVTLRHLGHDGQGFREYESVTLNSFYETIEAQGFKMTPAQMEYMQEKTEPYAAQYLRLGMKQTQDRKDELGESILPSRNSIPGDRVGSAAGARESGFRRPWGKEEKAQVARILDKWPD